MHLSCVNIDMSFRCFCFFVFLFFFLIKKVLSKTTKWWYLFSFSESQMVNSLLTHSNLLQEYPYGVGEGRRVVVYLHSI